MVVKSRKSIRVLIRAGVLLLFAGFLADSLYAQQPADEASLYQRRLDEAGRYLRRGSVGQARRIYEELLAQKPDDRTLFIGYVTARISLFELDGLSDAIREKLESNPTDTDYILLLGDALAAGGDTERADRTWRTVIPLFEKKGEAYRQIAARMEKQMMVLEAIELLHEGRAATGSPNIFARELVYLYDLTGNGEQQADECMMAVMEGTIKDGELLRRLKELRASEVIQHYPYAQLHAVLDSFPGMSGIREALAGFYLDDGKCRLALREYDILDRTLQGCGQLLLPFARAAYGKKCYPAAGEALENILERCDSPSIQIEAQFLLASIYRSSGNAEEAAALYHSLLRGTRNPGDIARARHDLAKVLLEDLGKPDEAMVVLGELLALKEANKYATEARFDLAWAHIIAGDFEGADAMYDRIESEATDNDTRERAIFGQGQADYYQGNFDDALEDYRRIIDQYPTGRYLNNVLEQSIFLSEHRDVGDAPLKVYTDCLLMIERREYRQVRTTIAEMIEALILSNLRNDFMWQLALIEEDEGNYGEAIAGLDLMIDEYPMDHLSMLAAVKAADIFCDQLHDLPAGIARYETFLVEHPGSILVNEVLRKKIEREKQNGS